MHPFEDAEGSSREVGEGAAGCGAILRRAAAAARARAVAVGRAEATAAVMAAAAPVGVPPAMAVGARGAEARAKWGS